METDNIPVFPKNLHKNRDVYDYAMLDGQIHEI